MCSNYLYRGINKEFYDSGHRILMPKTTSPFLHTFKYDGTIKADGSGTYGHSEQNAVLLHQLEQKGFPTSGISTTPLFERAKVYATENGKRSEGLVLKITRRELQNYKIKEFVVADWIPFPSISADKEVILVAENNGELPMDIVIELITVKA